MKNLIITVLLSALVMACEYVEREEFELQTIDGRIVTIACPVIDSTKSPYEYVIDGACIAYNEGE